jgi:5-methylcytosine-specific restriction endonuclease McrA
MPEIGTVACYRTRCGHNECKAANRDRIRAYRAANPVQIERNRIRTAMTRKANPARAKEITRNWYRNNTDKAKANARVQYYRRRGAVCDCMTASFMEEIAKLPCAYCGAPFEHADHVVPIAAGGLTCVENMAPACANCNQAKAAKLLPEAERPRPIMTCPLRASGDR